ncbi:hypothetical protein PILCRDRAFT_826077 [Piloderma croceum F 1598]|uniref:DRBM domain-containing protein n=1 Tax=Piloderma croceum (strain F 1598) TaxID=765440 RepID=A0A0C3ARY9_PILCF|nr:hypothetical protein PILCRDRAFT_826077 [Piloderma croceum F 1598]
MPDPGHRVQLNNYVQQMYKNSTSLSWDIQQQGPEHQPSWEAVAYINHVEYGRGTASRKDLASEEAARQALVNLRGY